MMEGPSEGSPRAVNGSGSGIADSASWEAEFREQVAAVEEAARAWGVRPESLEGRFVSALLTATGSLGRLCASALEGLETLARENREAAERELAAAKEITRAARAGLTQADVMLTVVQVEKENLVAKMIKETLPLFADRLKEALIIREKRWNDDVKRRRFATAGAVTLALVLGAYGVRAWQDNAVTGAFYGCLAHSLQASGHFYCDVTSFFGTSRQ
jgi:hypothetical protein